MSHRSTEPFDTRLDLLFVQLLEGGVSDAEKTELRALVEVDPRLASNPELRFALLSALSAGGPISSDLADSVMTLFAEADGWPELSSRLGEAIEMDVDSFLRDGGVVAGVEEAVAKSEASTAQLSMLYDGEADLSVRRSMAERLSTDREALAELSDYAQIGRLLREAVGEQARSLDPTAIWHGVAPAIGLENPEAVPGWEPVGALLRESFEKDVPLDVETSLALTESIMNALPSPQTERSLRDLAEELDAMEAAEREENALGVANLGPRFVLPAIVGLAAIWMFYVGGQADLEPGAPVSGTDAVAEAPASSDVDPAMSTSENTPDAATPVAVAALMVEVESIEVGDDVLVQVLQFDDDGPVFLMIDEEGEPMDGASL